VFNWLDKSLAILTSGWQVKLLEATSVEPTYAPKLRRRQAAFVHEVVETDAPKRIDQISQVDAPLTMGSEWLASDKHYQELLRDSLKLAGVPWTQSAVQVTDRTRGGDGQQ